MRSFVRIGGLSRTSRGSIAGSLGALAASGGVSTSPFTGELASAGSGLGAVISSMVACITSIKSFPFEKKGKQ